MSWRDIFWYIWGVLHVLFCHHCSHYFPAAQLQQCSFHPELPVYMPGRSSGRYPCCGSVALRSGVVQQYSDGCCSREHQVCVWGGVGGGGAPGVRVGGNGGQGGTRCAVCVCVGLGGGGAGGLDERMGGGHVGRVLEGFALMWVEFLKGLP